MTSKAGDSLAPAQKNVVWHRLALAGVGANVRSSFANCWNAFGRIAPPGQEGWLRDQEKCRVSDRNRADGVVAQDRKSLVEIGPPPRPLHQRKLRDIFLNVAATPPGQEGQWIARRQHLLRAVRPLAFHRTGHLDEDTSRGSTQSHGNDLLVRAMAFGWCWCSGDRRFDVPPPDCGAIFPCGSLGERTDCVGRERRFHAGPRRRDTCRASPMEQFPGCFRDVVLWRRCLSVDGGVSTPSRLRCRKHHWHDG